MDIQATLTLMIQAVVMSFVALMVFDFVGGLWVVPLPPAGWQPPVIEQPTVSAVVPQPTEQQHTPQATPLVPQFEEIPDPWSLEPAPGQKVNAQAVIISFPTRRSLPPAQTQEVELTKTKRRSQPKKSTQTKSPSQPKQRMKAV